MSFWSNRIADDAYVVKDEQTVIAHCDSQQVASKIVNALNHACHGQPCTVCDKFGGQPVSEASVCAGHYFSLKAKLGRIEG